MEGSITPADLSIYLVYQQHGLFAAWPSHTSQTSSKSGTNTGALRAAMTPLLAYYLFRTREEADPTAPP